VQLATLSFPQNCYATMTPAIGICLDCLGLYNFSQVDLLPRDAMQARPMPSCGVFVCVSVTFVHSVKTNKDIFNFFSPPGSHTILVFFTPNGIAIFRRETPPPLKRASNAGGVGRNRDSEPISRFTAVNAATGQVL